MQTNYIKHIKNTLLFTSVCIVLALILITSSCKKDETANSSQVELLSFGPSGVKIGDQIHFIGKNLDKVLAIKLNGDSVPQSSFVDQTKESITIVISETVERGPVTLVTKNGNIVSKTILDLEVPVTITSITPSSRPGENITITGEHVNWINGIVFPNNILVSDTDFVSISLTDIVVKVPIDAQTGTLTINCGGTKPVSVDTFNLNVTLPSFSDFTPNPVYAGTNLTITGTDLDLTMGILFHGVADTIKEFVSQSPTELVVTVPNQTTKGTIQLVAHSRVAVPSASNLTIVLPTISDFSPSPADRGSNITITGTDLNLVSGVYFSGALDPVTEFVSQSPTELVVTVPDKATTGKIKLVAAYSNVNIESSNSLAINGGLPPVDPLGYVIYADALADGWQDWSWADGHDFSSTENVREGSNSIKATYSASDGYQGVTFHNVNGGIATDTYSMLVLNVFGGTGTEGKNLNVVINGGWSNPPQVVVKEGEWTTYSVDLSGIGNPNPITEIVLQTAGWGGTIYIDYVGFK